VGFPADRWGYPVRSGNAAHVVGAMAEGSGDTSALALPLPYSMRA
jgi:hypothetical protein